MSEIDQNTTVATALHALSIEELQAEVKRRQQSRIGDLGRMIAEAERNLTSMRDELARLTGQPAEANEAGKRKVPAMTAAERQIKVLDALEAGHNSAAAIAREVGIDRFAASKTLAALKAEGKVASSGGTKSATYSLVG